VCLRAGRHTIVLVLSPQASQRKEGGGGGVGGNWIQVLRNAYPKEDEPHQLKKGLIHSQGLMGQIQKHE